jgi:hypothetical protein
MKQPRYLLDASVEHFRSIADARDVLRVFLTTLRTDLSQLSIDPDGDPREEMEYVPRINSETCPPGIGE